jgi:hypothetical protein
VKKTLVILAVALCATVAWAIPTNITRILNLGVSSGLYLGAASTWSSTSVLTESLGATTSFVFPDDGGCQESSAVTITGAAVGDVCLLGHNVTAPNVGGSYSCYVSATNAAKVRFCPVAAAFTPADAGFVLRTFSNQ